MSAVLSLHPGKYPHEVWHDLESFIHVLHWCCLRFHKTNYTHDIGALEAHIYRSYDMYTTEGGVSIGGTYKLYVMMEGIVPFLLPKRSLPTGNARRNRISGYGLRQLLASLSSLYKEHYEYLETCGKFPDLFMAADPEEPVATAPEEGEEAFADDKPDEMQEDEQGSYEDEVEEPARPMLGDHTAILHLLQQALDTRKHKWIYDPKLPDMFAKFENSHPAQRASASSQSLKRLADGSIDDEKQAKRAKRGDSSGYASGSGWQLGSISEGMPTQVG